MTVDDTTISSASWSKTRVVRDVTSGQVISISFIALCVALHPGFVLKANEGGMSDYGVHLKTVLPYTIALFSAAALSFRAGQFLFVRTSAARRFKQLLRLYSALTMLTLLSTYPYTLNETFKVIHVGVGVAIVLFETVASCWMYAVLRRYPLVLIIELVGFVLAGLTFLGVLHVLFLTEALICVGFAWLVIATAVALA